MSEIVITHGVRTPIGKFGGSLSNISDLDLAAFIIEQLVGKRAELAHDNIDHVIMGEVRQNSYPANLARVAALKAGLPESIPAYTVHRQCGSGLQSIMDAYQLISCGEAQVVVAGGAENMSQSSYFLRNTSDGLGTGHVTIEDALIAGGPGAVPSHIYGNLPMGITAENLADMYNISREEQDIFAQRSQERMDIAIKEGRFQSQIAPIEVKTAKGKVVFNTDEHPFLSTLEKLSTLKPVFKKGGSVTAGNSSGRNDGAAAVLVMTREKAESLGYKPIVTIKGIGASGCEPKYMGLGPVESSRIALEKAGIDLSSVDVVELNEAFAAQSIAVIREWEKWGNSQESLVSKINPNGGAIAHGHPLGCTGAALTIKCMYELMRVPEKKYGLISLCCAGGLGVAMVVEKSI